MMIDRALTSKLLEIRDLPTLPEVVEKILRKVEDRKTTATELTALLEQDPAISARLLRLANSAFYGLRHNVDTVQRAVVVVGFDAVRHLSLAMSVFEAFTRHKQSAFDPFDFWLHSLGAAKSAQLICRADCKVESPGGCFTAALLHDIGKYLLALVFPEEYDEALSESRENHRPLIETETERFNATHREAGHWIAERWGLPELIVDVIGNLHQVGGYGGRYKKEVAITSLADLLSRTAEFGDAGDWEQAVWDEESLRVTGLSQGRIDELLRELGDYREETRQFLHMMTVS